MKSEKPKARRPRAGKTAGIRSLRPAGAEAARLRVARRRRPLAKTTFSEGAAGADAAEGVDQGSGTSSTRKGRGRSRKRAEEKTEPAEAKPRAKKSQAGGKNQADQRGRIHEPKQVSGRGHRSKAPAAAATEPAKLAGDRRRSAPKPGVGAAVAQERSDREPVGRAGSTWNAAPAAVAGRGESWAAAPSGSWSLDASSEAATLMRDALELGAEAMREVAAARTLPEVFEAQMRYGRAASQIWMRQVQIASSLLRPSLGSWWMSSDVMGARLPE